MFLCSCVVAQLCGLEAIRTKDVNKTHQLLIQHLYALRSHSELQHCLFVLVLESNLGFESQHLAAALQRDQIQNWITLTEGAGGAAGWLTTHASKEAMCLRTRESLRLGTLVQWDKFISNGQPPNDALKQLQKELLNFSIITEPAKHVFGIARKTYTGKIGCDAIYVYTYLLTQLNTHVCRFLVWQWSTGRPLHRLATGHQRLESVQDLAKVPTVPMEVCVPNHSTIHPADSNGPCPLLQPADGRQGLDPRGTAEPAFLPTEGMLVRWSSPSVPIPRHAVCALRRREHAACGPKRGA